MIKIPFTFYFDKTAAECVATVRKATLTPAGNGDTRIVLDDYDVAYADGTPVPTDLLDENGTAADEIEEVLENVLSL